MVEFDNVMFHLMNVIDLMIQNGSGSPLRIDAWTVGRRSNTTRKPHNYSACNTRKSEAGNAGEDVNYYYDYYYYY